MTAIPLRLGTLLVALALAAPAAAESVIVDTTWSFRDHWQTRDDGYRYEQIRRFPTHSCPYDRSVNRGIFSCPVYALPYDDGFRVERDCTVDQYGDEICREEYRYRYEQHPLFFPYDHRDTRDPRNRIRFFGACPRTFQCSATPRGNRCIDTTLDCGRGYRLECRGSCGSTTCSGQCCHCVRAY